MNIHRYPAPFRPDLSNPEDTRHFDDDIPAEVCSFSHLRLTVIRSLRSPSPQPMVLPQMLLEIHYCATRSMDKKFWTSAKHLRSQDSLIKVPGRSAMSAPTKHLTRSLIPTVKRSLSGAAPCCARPKKSVKGARSQCDL